MGQQAPNDNHWHRIEELRHERHAIIREQARAGDGTIEQGEQELARIRAAKHRNEIAALKAQNDDLRRQLAEVR
jgi:cell division protein FtsB